MLSTVKAILGKISGIDKKSMELAKEELNKKMKPKDSLGVLEKIAIQLSGIYGFPIKEIKKRCHIVVSADNGIIEEGVSSCPIEYTRIVSEAMLNEIAAIGILTRRLNVELNLVDIGIKNPLKNKYPNLYQLNIRKGTNNFYKEPAMSIEDCVKAIHTGIKLIEEKGEDVTIFSNGEMGIGNTTTSSAVLYSLTRGNIDQIVGRGGGLSDEGLLKKKKVVLEATKRYNTFDMDPVEILAYVGGLDIACIVGLYLGCAKYKKMMLVDGFISAVACLTACKIEPLVAEYVLFTHMSEEPGMKIVMDALNKESFLNMKMRLGEGTGAVLTYPIIDCAVDIINKMKTPSEVYELYANNN